MEAVRRVTHFSPDPTRDEGERGGVLPRILVQSCQYYPRMFFLYCLLTSSSRDLQDNNLDVPALS